MFTDNDTRYAAHRSLKLAHMNSYDIQWQFYVI